MISLELPSPLDLESSQGNRFTLERTKASTLKSFEGVMKEVDTRALEHPRDELGLSASLRVTCERQSQELQTHGSFT